MWFFDPVYLLFALPGLLLALAASWITKSTFSRYSKVAASSGLTGAEAARRLLRHAGINDVNIEPVQGFLSDHYDPSAKTLRLSPGVYASRGLSAIGVACHEAGHAIQHSKAFAPLALRSLMVPATNLTSTLAMPMIIGGFLLSVKPLILIGALLFAVAVVFSIITLPVEWDASARAKKMMVSAGIVSQTEAADAGRVLNAAFLTYVAAAVSAILTLLYYLMRAGVFGGGDD